MSSDSEKPVRRFESFGDIDKVLREVDIHVPVIFGDDGVRILEPLKSIIQKYASSQAWGKIALSLSQGMARRELDELLEREIGHEGPLVIDPNASTEEHQVYQSQAVAKLQKDRLVRANEATGEILTVIYGIESTDIEVQTRLLKHRVRMAELTLEQAEENDGASTLPKLSPQHARRLKMVRRRLKQANQMIGTADDLNEDIHGELFLALATLLQMNDASSTAIKNLTHQLGILPEQFNNVSYAPFHQAAPASVQVNRPEEKPAAPAPLPQLKR
jgi:hypothetical protein